LYVFIGSFVYFEQKNLLADFSRAERTQILGSVDWLVNLVTFGMAFFLTGRIVGKLGMAAALALMPFLVGAGLLILAFAPMLTVLLALQVFRRGGNYGLTRPAREMLYTKVTQEERFKAKPVVDIVVYRGGDAVSGTLFAFLTDGVGLGLAAVAVVGSAIAAVWGSTGIWLGKKFDLVKNTGDEA
jgi:AAA family ATP:ADP antiporter